VVVYKTAAYPAHSGYILSSELSPGSSPLECDPIKLDFYLTSHAFAPRALTSHKSRIGQVLATWCINASRDGATVGTCTSRAGGATAALTSSSQSLGAARDRKEIDGHNCSACARKK